MLNKKIIVFICIGILGILLLMGYIFRVDRFGMASIDWVDCIQINNVKYYKDVNKVPIESSLVDKKIGKVKFNVSENVHNSGYMFRNGDATYLEVGTEINSLKSDNNAIAIKINGLYYLYKVMAD